MGFNLRGSHLRAAHAVTLRDARCVVLRGRHERLRGMRRARRAAGYMLGWRARYAIRALEVQFVGNRENDCRDAVARRGASRPWRCGVPPSQVDPQPSIVSFDTSDHETLTERHPNHSATASNDRPIITLASGGPAARQIPACRAPTMHRAASAPPNRADHLLRVAGWW